MSNLFLTATPECLSLTFAKATRAHEEHPQRNEDDVLTDPESRLAVICDGVGHVTGARQAARAATRTVRARWRETLAARRAEGQEQSACQIPAEELDATLHYLLTEANTAVLAVDARMARRARADENAKKKGYAGTTIALVLLLPQGDGYLMGYAHVGDSRVYLLRSQEPLQRLTADDGYFEWKMGKGELNAEQAWRIEQTSSAEQLTEQDREHFNNRNRISQALGDKQDITLHTGQTSIRPGDRVLLTTDGIHDNLTDAELEETARPGTRTTVAKKLLMRTIERSQQGEEVCLRAKKDDMSVIVITCHTLSGDRQ